MELLTLLRTVAFLVLRVLGVVLLVLAAVDAVALAKMLWAVHNQWTTFYSDRGFERVLFLTLEAFFGFAMVRWTGPLTLWVLPRVSRTCLRCGHPVEERAGVCSECGQAR